MCIHSSYLGMDFIVYIADVHRYLLCAGFRIIGIWLEQKNFKVLHLHCIFHELLIKEMEVRFFEFQFSKKPHRFICGISNSVDRGGEVCTLTRYFRRTFVRTKRLTKNCDGLDKLLVWIKCL